MAGTVTQRGKTWRLQYRQKGYPPIYKTFDTEEEAKDEAEAIRYRRKNDIKEKSKASAKTTLAEMLVLYENEITVTKKGRKREASRIGVWKRHPLASRFLNNISRADLSDYIQNRRKTYYNKNGQKKKVTDATILQEILLISSVFKYARMQRSIDIENPVSGMTLPKGSSSRSRRFRQHEAEYLYKALEAINPLHRFLAEFAVETAMRQGEILSLTWDNISTKNTRVVLEKDKSGNELVGFPISTRATAILNSLRPSGDDHGIFMIPIFKMSQDRISRAFRTACKAGREAFEQDTGKPAPHFLADLRYHDLRHEATSRLFEKGMNRGQVQMITRHKTPAMLDRYTHLDHTETSDIVRLLG